MYPRESSWWGLLLLLVAAMSWAQNAPRRIAGDVVRFEGGTLAVRTAAGGEESVKILDKARITSRTKGDVDQVPVNSFIGVTAAPRADGTLVASEIQIFPESMRGTGEGHRPMEGANTMTNATVTNYARAQARSTTAEGTMGKMVQENAERRMTLTYKGGEKQVVVPPGAVVFVSDIGDTALLKPGAHVVVYATPQADGSLGADRVSVGMNGYVPPR
jgi:hypothetical protein